MKRLLALVVLLGLVLAGCTTAKSTETDTQIATKVSQILTNMPTSTRASFQVVTVTSGPTQAGQATATKAQATPVLAGSATVKPGSQTAPAPTATRPPATATVAATAVPATAAAPSATLPATDPRTTLGNPTWRDTMDKSDNWPLGDDAPDYSDISFKDGQMVFTAKQAVDGWRLTKQSAVNFYLEMTVKTDKCQDNDRWGMFVRVPNISTANQGYLVGINCKGEFGLREWNGAVLPGGAMTTLIDWKTNKAIQAGAGKTNRLGLMAKGSKLSVFGNGVLVGEVTDGTFTADGHFGVFAGAHSSDTVTILVDEMTFWELP